MKTFRKNIAENFICDSFSIEEQKLWMHELFVNQIVKVSSESHFFC